MRLSKMKVLKSALRCKDNVMETLKLAQKVYKTTCMYKAHSRNSLFQMSILNILKRRTTVQR